MTAGQIAYEIETGMWDRSELGTMRSALRCAYRVTNAIAKLSLHEGDRVQFQGKGMEVAGVIVKMCRTNVLVKADNGAHWRVSPSALKPEEAQHG